jgi:hypothetical protein
MNWESGDPKGIINILPASISANPTSRAVPWAGIFLIKRDPMGILFIPPVCPSEKNPTKGSAGVPMTKRVNISFEIDNMEKKATFLGEKILKNTELFLSI